MTKKNYDWAASPVLEEHSRRKLKILREYFSDYLSVRCRLPQQEKFRMAIIDGFSGGGRYKCGSAGSPIVFVEELKTFSEAVNIKRAAEGMSPIAIECLLLLNDESAEAIEILKSNVAPLEAEIRTNVPRLHLRMEYLNAPFESAFSQIKDLLEKGRYTNALFNLDQYGDSEVQSRTLIEIMRTYTSAEIFYTFGIEALISFLRKSDPIRLAQRLAHLGLSDGELKSLQGAMNRHAWLAAAERLVFENFRNCAPFVSPFSMHNPEGWRYWLIHFANFYKARQVYNNILHRNSSAQAHFGRSGLNMLSYNPLHEDGRLYLFDDAGRQVAHQQLMEDVPRLISESGDVIGVAEFYEGVYNLTPAHTDDIHAAIIQSPDIEVITPGGGERRKANTIAVGDVLKLKNQKSFFPLFLSAADRKKK